MQATLIQTLLVEDSPGDTMLLQQMLADAPLWHAQLTCTERLQTAIALCQQQQFDVILLDLSLPDSQGYATFEQLHQQTAQTPIILLTGFDDQELALRAVRAGAQDYLIKGEINAQLLLRAMRYGIERKRTEEALREHHLRYQALFENNHIGVFIVNVNGFLLNLNQQGAVMLGASVDQLINTPIHHYIVPHEHDQFYKQMHALVQGEILPLYEQTFLCCDGSELPVELHNILVRNANGDILYIQSIARNISKRKQAEAALQAEQAQLAQRVEERTKELSIANADLKRSARLKDEFLATISHELRTPLSVMLTLSEALQDEIYGATTERQRKAVERIVKSGRHLLELINDIIDISKFESGKLTLEIGPVSITTLCEDCLQMVQETAQIKRLQLTKNIRLANDLLYADGRRLMQILLNLLNNAVKFTPDNGQIGLEIVEDIEHERLTFTVWDTGIGIATEDISKLFRPFIQLDSKLSRQYQGAGLGLALVYRLTKLHGGSVTVASTPNRGSRFVIALPHHSKRESISSKRPLTNGAVLPILASGANHTDLHPLFLLADDNEVNLNDISFYVEQVGCRWVLAQTGLDVMLQAQKYLPDLILIDSQLPPVGGIEAIRQLREFTALKDIPIVVLTALDIPGENERFLAIGADGYLSKPVSLQQMQRLLLAYLQPKARVRVY